MENLPSDILTQIFSYLDLRNRLNLRVSHRFDEIEANFKLKLHSLQIDLYGNNRVSIDMCEKPSSSKHQVVIQKETRNAFMSALRRLAGHAHFVRVTVFAADKSILAETSDIIRLIRTKQMELQISGVNDSNVIDFIDNKKYVESPYLWPMLTGKGINKIYK
ncbi:hypothetical protein PFISCL1PPCAC_19223, partial [Pristionchus fissidentatus]